MRKPMSWRYIAGFFDGEGCVITFSSGTGSSRHLRISLSQVRIKVLREIHAFLGYGRISTRPNGVSNLYITGKANILHFLDGIDPYIIVKAPEATIAREFVENVTDRGKVLTKRARARRVQLSEDLRRANASRL